LHVSHGGEGNVTDGVITASFGDVEDTEWREISFQVKIEMNQFGKAIENIAEVHGDNVKEPHRSAVKINVEPDDSSPVPEDDPSDPVEEEGEKLPRTATNVFNIMFIGLVILLAGLLMIR